MHFFNSHFYEIYQIINIVMIVVIFYMANRLYSHLDRLENRALFLAMTGLVLDVIGQYSTSHCTTVESAAIGLRLSISGQAFFGMGFILYITRLYEVKHGRIVSLTWFVTIVGAFTHAFMLSSNNPYLANPYIKTTNGVSALVGNRGIVYFLYISGMTILSIRSVAVALSSLIKNYKQHEKYFRRMTIIYIILILIHHVVININIYEFMKMPDFTAIIRGIGMVIYFSFAVKYNFFNFDELANKAALNDIGAGFIVLSTKLEIMYANGVAREILEEMNKSDSNIHEVLRQIVDRKELQATRNGSNYKVVADRIYTKGKLKGYSILVTDVTDIVQLEKRAEQNSLASARLLTNISHELRTPLNAISGAAKILENSAYAKENVKEYVNVVNSSAENLTEMISDFLEASGDNNVHESVHNAPYNVCTLVSNVTDYCGKKAEKKRMKFSVSFATDVPTRALGDDRKISQVITNILTNAIKYTDEGSINLRVAGEYRKDGLFEYEYILTDIGNNPFETDSYISEAFSSEKSEVFNMTSGYEISLYVARRLVNDLGGTISLATLDGRGCIFRIKIPQEVVDNNTLTSHNFANKMKLIMLSEDTDFVNDVTATCHDYGIITDRISGIQGLRKNTDDSYPYYVLAYDYASFDKKVQASEKAHNYVKVAILEAGKVPKKYEQGVVYINKPFSILSIRRILLVLEEFDGERFDENRFTAPSAKVLVVDDNQLNLQMAYTMLEQFKVSVTVANSGFECLSLLNAGNKYDIILMDYMMDGLDGLETTAKIREMDSDIKEVPIIAFTANSVRGAAEKYISGGMDDCIFKPATMSDFETVLRKFLPENMIIVEKYTGDIINDMDSFPEIEGVDTKLASQYMGHNLEMYKDMLVSFALDIKDREEMILDAWDREDYKNFIIQVHGVKGISRNLGMTELSAKMEAMEHAAKEENYEYVRTNLSELLSYYRRFTKILMPYVEEKEKKRASYTVTGEVGQVLLKMNELLEEFEIGAAEKLFYTIWPGEYDEEREPLMRSLKESIEKIDYYESLENVEQLLSTYTNKED